MKATALLNNSNIKVVNKVASDCKIIYLDESYDCPTINIPQIIADIYIENDDFLCSSPCNFIQAIKYVCNELGYQNLQKVKQETQQNVLLTLFIWSMLQPRVGIMLALTDKLIAMNESFSELVLYDTSTTYRMRRCMFELLLEANEEAAEKILNDAKQIISMNETGGDYSEVINTYTFEKAAMFQELLEVSQSNDVYTRLQGWKLAKNVMLADNEPNKLKHKRTKLDVQRIGGGIVSLDSPVQPGITSDVDMATSDFEEQHLPNDNIDSLDDIVGRHQEQHGRRTKKLAQAYFDRGVLPEICQLSQLYNSNALYCDYLPVISGWPANTLQILQSIKLQNLNLSLPACIVIQGDMAANLLLRYIQSIIYLRLCALYFKAIVKSDLTDVKFICKQWELLMRIVDRYNGAKILGKRGNGVIVQGDSIMQQITLLSSDVVQKLIQYTAVRSSDLQQGKNITRNVSEQQIQSTLLQDYNVQTDMLLTCFGSSACTHSHIVAIAKGGSVNINGFGNVVCKSSTQRQQLVDQNSQVSTYVDKSRPSDEQIAYNWEMRKQCILNQIQQKMPENEWNLFYQTLNKRSRFEKDKGMYGKNKGDQGAKDTFLEYKCGDYRRLNPYAWEVLLPDGCIATDVWGVKLEFIYPMHKVLQATNVYQDENDVQKAAKVFQQYEHDHIIEVFDASDITDDLVQVINPIIVVPKDDHEVRPVLDCTKSGLNKSLNPWGMSLPTFQHFTCMLKPGFKIGKRDFRHGFHHQTVDQNSRKYLAFNLPAQEGKKIGRFNVLPFGLSQAPSKFQEVSNAFGQVAFRELKYAGMKNFMLGIYVDDLGAGSETNQKIFKQILDDLADILGVLFKSSKDVWHATQMKYLGIELKVCTECILVRVPQDFIRDLSIMVENILIKPGGRTVKNVEKLAGKLQHAAIILGHWKQYIRSLYDDLTRIFQCHPMSTGESCIDWRQRIQNEDVTFTDITIQDLQYIKQRCVADAGWHVAPTFEWSPWTWVAQCDVMEFSTDASGEWGLGAEFNGDYIQRQWEHHEKILPIYIKEIIAISEAITAWSKHWKNQKLLAWCDNQAAIRILSKQCGPQEVGPYVKHIIAELHKIKAQIRWAYIPSKQNVVADMLSRGQGVCSCPKMVLQNQYLIQHDILHIDVVVGADNMGRAARLVSNNAGVKWFDESANVLQFLHTLQNKSVWVQPHLDQAKFLLPQIFQQLRQQKVKCCIYILTPHDTQEVWFQKLFFGQANRFTLIKIISSTEAVWWSIEWKVKWRKRGLKCSSQTMSIWKAQI